MEFPDFKRAAPVPRMRREGAGGGFGEVAGAGRVSGARNWLPARRRNSTGATLFLGAVGERKVQVLARAQAAIPTLAGAHRSPSASAVCSLGSALWTRPNGSRMMREYHVRF